MAKIGGTRTPGSCVASAQNSGEVTFGQRRKKCCLE